MKSFRIKTSQRSLFHRLCAPLTCCLVNIVLSLSVDTAFFTHATNGDLIPSQSLPDNSLTAFNPFPNWTNDSDENLSSLEQRSSPSQPVFAYQQVDNVIASNQSLEKELCDLAFISEAEKKEFASNPVIVNDTLPGAVYSRARRALPKIYTIETAIFVDQTLARRFEGRFDELKRLVMAIMNEVQLIYEYSSMRTRVKIVVVKFEVLNGHGPRNADGDIDRYLDNFCGWQAQRLRHESWDSRWDHALMLTGLDLFKDIGNGKRNKKVLGLAWVNGMCKPTYSCTLNEGKSFEAAYVIAHELGHSLGILHDGRGNNCDPDRFIMSEKTGPGKVNWSPCSNVYIDNFMSRGNGRCLENMAVSSVDLDFRRSNRLPGEQFTANMQCQLALGNDYRAYITGKEPFRSICRELWCISGSWATPAHPALEGSQCSADGERCFQGDCTHAFVRKAIIERPSYFGSTVPVNRRAFSMRRWNRNRTGVRQRFRPPIGAGRRTGSGRSGAVSEAGLEARSMSQGNESGSNVEVASKKSESKEKSILESIGRGIKSFAESAKNFFTKIFA